MNNFFSLTCSVHPKNFTWFSACMRIEYERRSKTDSMKLFFFFNYNSACLWGICKLHMFQLTEKINIGIYIFFTKKPQSSLIKSERYKIYFFRLPLVITTFMWANHCERKRGKCAFKKKFLFCYKWTFLSIISHVNVKILFCCYFSFIFSWKNIVKEKNPL